MFIFTSVINILKHCLRHWIKNFDKPQSKKPTTINHNPLHHSYTFSSLSISILLFFSLFLSGCGELFVTKVKKEKAIHKPYYIKNSFGSFKVVPQKHIELEQTGIASYYGSDFHGKPTAIGSKFNMHAYTAAHKTAHLPSIALITHKNKSRIVLLNDRGPFCKNRILDCSQQLAQDLGFAKQGSAKIHIKVLKDETLALKQNGGHIVWDGSSSFPLITKNTKHVAHFAPTKNKNSHKNHTHKTHKSHTTKPKIKITIRKLTRKKNKIRYVQ